MKYVTDTYDTQYLLRRQSHRAAIMRIYIMSHLMTNDGIAIVVTTERIAWLENDFDFDAHSFEVCSLLASA